MEICGSQKSWKANQSHNVEGNHFFLFLSYHVPVTLVVRTHLATLQILKYSWTFSLPHILVIPWIILTKKKRFVTITSKLKIYFHRVNFVLSFSVTCDQGYKVNNEGYCDGMF